MTHGTHAEYVCTIERKLIPKPARLSFEEAGAVQASALTALTSLRDKGDVQAGQEVMIIGASGGVGSFAVQIAKAFGAEVTGVCSTAKVEMVRSIGADHVVDYREEDITQCGRRYDLILDIGGNRPLSTLRRALRSKGTLVIVGAETDGPWFGGVGRQLATMAISPLVSQDLKTMIASDDKEHLLALGELLSSGQVTPVIDRAFPLSDTSEAIRYLSDGHARGKLVVIV